MMMNFYIVLNASIEKFKSYIIFFQTVILVTFQLKIWRQIVLKKRFCKDFEGILLSAISQTDKYCIISLICGILKKQTYRNRAER